MFTNFNPCKSGQLRVTLIIVNGNDEETKGLHTGVSHPGTM